jgi:enamine deaminase RidA (YjgF/YER057c/UK114 family)
MSNTSPMRLRLDSGGSWEEAFGYSRAIRTGDRIFVSGSTSVVDGVVLHAADAGAQMRVALDTALDAVTSLGGTPGDVIRTRMYVVHRADCDTVGRIHAERFADVRPAATMVLVAGLIDEEMLVEVEVEARVGSAKPYGHRGPYDHRGPDDRPRVS